MRSGLKTRAATFVKYRLPEHNHLTPDGDNATLTLLGVTSLNSTFAFIMSAGAHQSACFNGQVFITGEAGLFKARHQELGYQASLSRYCQVS